jgi:4-amino-4-deoxy-L-arabinose transferase-like glycosyltransferase
VEPRRPTFEGREALSILLVAIVLRLAFVLAFDTPANVERGLWEWGYEAGSIANSLHEGKGFANVWTRDVPPWSLGSGATGWLGPVYPAFLSWLLDLTDGLTRTTAWILFAVQSVLSALTCVLVWGLGTRLGAPRAGRIAAWALCVHPLSIWHAAATVWDTTFAAFTFTAVLAALAACERDAGKRGWTWLGLLIGASLLVNAAPIILVPIVAWVAWRARPGLGSWAGAIGPCLLATGAVALPWMLRNAGEVGSFALRTSLGVELRVGNHDGADGHYARDRHPSHSPEEFLRYRAMGEAAYAKACSTEAWSWIGENPGRFAVLTLRRTAAWWIGEDPYTDPRLEYGRAARDDPRSWGKWILHLLVGVLGLLGAGFWARAQRAPRPYLLSLFLLPPVYCVSHVMERYRWPLEPLLVLAGAWLVARWLPKLGVRRGDPPG